MPELYLGGTQNTTPVKNVVVNAGTLNRHGLIAGATGTGKTVTLQVLAESLSDLGVPVFLADIKGDLSGLGASGKSHPKITERLDSLQKPEHNFAAKPVVFWDLHGKAGHPLRTTLSEIGPLLLANLLELNDTQTGILHACFQEADQEGLLMLDLDDLNAMLTYLQENAKELSIKYGTISPASIGAIKRRLIILEGQGIRHFLGEPAVSLDDFIQVASDGVGQINILDATKIIHEAPRLYATVLLWLLSELFEQLPEVGDPEIPKFALFLDEAHLLFKDTPKALQNKIEQVVRLIRSKGVGVFFVTQSPLDIPAPVAGQLGLKVQHALRAFTPKDKKNLAAVSDTFRQNPAFDTREVLPSLGVGEALISSLDEEGAPTVVQNTLLAPPQSRIGPLKVAERRAILSSSSFAGVFETAINRESAYERLAERAERELEREREDARREEAYQEELRWQKKTTSKPRRSSRQTSTETLVKSISRTVGSQIGRQIVRGLLGALKRSMR